MPIFLHRPVRDTAEVLRYVDERRSENCHLDFKQKFWDARQPTSPVEAAKDVAAFANADGGDIVIGIIDEADCAAGFYSSEVDAAVAFTQLRDWLRNRLRPRDVAETIDVVPLDVPQASETSRVLVISVPPWAHGPVAVDDSSTSSEKPRFFFPLRRGKRTVYLTFEELMRLADSHRRSMFLRLRELESFGKDVYIASPVDNSMKFASRVRDRHGELLVITADTIELTMRWDDGKNAGKLVIPLELIRAAWMVNEVIHLALDATVRNTFHGWVIIVGSELREDSSPQR